MKIIYFDCFSGISGDMILGALLDTGLISFSDLNKELAKLNASGFEISRRKVIKKGISGTKVDVIVKENLNGERKSRNLKDILEIINKSGLSDTVKEKSCEVFTKLAHAEAKAHNTSKDKIHFHEIGAMDSIIDIIGSIAGIELLNADKIYSSPVHLGRGFVNCAHGQIPVPAPATLLLAKKVPVYSKGIENELTTPTGMAILTTICSSFDNIPAILPIEVGYGAGNSDLPHPNLLRLIIGETYVDKEHTKDAKTEEFISIIKANIDDMNPEHYSNLMDLCLKNGALDVYYTPIYMKKNRPGTEVTVLSPIDKTKSLIEVVFRNTTTIGVRSYPAERQKLNRESIAIDTSVGKARIKVSFKDNTLYNWTPEYEDALSLSSKTEKPLKEIYDIIIKEFLNQKDDLLNHFLHPGQ